MADDFQISTLDMLAANPSLAITEGIAYEAPYLYVTPHNDFVIAKIDTRTFAIVDTLDLSKFDAGLTGMLGSFTADGFLYVLPHLSATGPVYQNDVVRVDLANFTPAGCSTLAVLKASQALSGSNGWTDGTNGYLNVQAKAGIVVARFGLGKNFTPASVQTLAIPTVNGSPAIRSNLVAVDETNAYVITTVASSLGIGGGSKQMDLWLATIPTANFTAKAATFQRLTNLDMGGALPQAYTVVDDGENLWVPPLPIVNGPKAGTFIGVMKIPKANPAAFTTSQGPSSQPFPPLASASGNAVYDGWRYGYIAAQSTAQILQLDTHKPGTVNLIDISAYSGGYAMYGLGYDGTWAYAVSFNGGGGLCLKFLPTPDPSGVCPCCLPA